MKKTNNFKFVLNVFAIVLIIAIIVSAAFFGIEIWEERNSSFDDDGSLIATSTLIYDGKTFEKKKDINTFLVLGLDKISDTSSSDSYTNDRQSDFLVLLIFDNNEKTCNVLQINRDTIAEINVLGVAGDKVGTVNKQIALAHTYGNGKEVSCRNAANSVSKLLMGIDVDHYLSFTMDAVPVVTDLVGGVEVTVLDDFSNINPVLVKGENINLNGELALTYVRSRSGLDDATNKARMQRQSQFIKSFYSSLNKKIEEDKSFVSNAYMNISSHIVSDCNSSKLEGILKKASEYTFGEIFTLKGEEKIRDNYLEFYPDDESIKEVVLELFYNEK